VGFFDLWRNHSSGYRSSLRWRGGDHRRGYGGALALEVDDREQVVALHVSSDGLSFDLGGYGVTRFGIAGDGGAHFDRRAGGKGR
jgi:hypothetical protein